MNETFSGTLPGGASSPFDPEGVVGALTQCFGSRYSCSWRIVSAFSSALSLSYCYKIANSSGPKGLLVPVYKWKLLFRRALLGRTLSTRLVNVGTTILLNRGERVLVRSRNGSKNQTFGLFHVGLYFRISEEAPTQIDDTESGGHASASDRNLSAPMTISYEAGERGGFDRVEIGEIDGVTMSALPTTEDDSRVTFTYAIGSSRGTVSHHDRTRRIPITGTLTVPRVHLEKAFRIYEDDQRRPRYLSANCKQLCAQAAIFFTTVAAFLYSVDRRSAVLQLCLPVAVVTELVLWTLYSLTAYRASRPTARERLCLGAMLCLTPFIVRKARFEQGVPSDEPGKRVAWISFSHRSPGPNPRQTPHPNHPNAGLGTSDRQSAGHHQATSDDIAHGWPGSSNNSGTTIQSTAPERVANAGEAVGVEDRVVEYPPARAVDESFDCTITCGSFGTQWGYNVMLPSCWPSMATFVVGLSHALFDLLVPLHNHYRGTKIVFVATFFSMLSAHSLSWRRETVSTAAIMAFPLILPAFSVAHDFIFRSRIGHKNDLLWLGYMFLLQVPDMIWLFWLHERLYELCLK